MRRSGTAVPGRAVDFAQTADTDGFAQVDVAGDGRGADIEPVDGLRGEFFGGAGFDGVDPTGNRKFSLSLQESRIGIDELLRLQTRKKQPNQLSSFRQRKSFDSLSQAPLFSSRYRKNSCLCATLAFESRGIVRYASNA